MIRALAATLALGAAAAPVHAADGAGNYAIWGAGGRSCNQFLHAREGDENGAFRHYLMGYLTAYNALQGDTYNALGPMSLEDALGWLADYCDLHKLDSFERGIAELVIAHHEQRQRTAKGMAGAWGRPPATPAATR